MSIKVEDNKTHWRSSDIKCLVEAAVSAAGPTDKHYAVFVDWIKPGGSTGVQHLTLGNLIRLIIRLPRRGPKDHHENPMLAIALSAVVPESGTVLAMQEAFRVANTLGHIVTVLSHDKNGPAKLRPDAAIDSQPTWAPIETFVIQKYKDPKLDGTFRDFVAKKEKALARAEKDAERAEAEVEAAQRRLKKAVARRKAAEKSLQAARARRS